MSGYFKSIKDSFRTLSGGLKLTLGYLFEATKMRKPIGVKEDGYFEADKGIFTLQYPHESFPVPDNGRYRLHNEIDDCIVCDKCAKVCPVDCIEIEPIKATESFGETSDGTSKRIYAATFDIDMGKCCFCGLCTTVCPTECLTMTKVYDFSEFDVKDHKYSFAEMSLVEIAEKRKEAEESDRKKEAAKLQAADENEQSVVNRPGKPIVNAEGSSEIKERPAFRPIIPGVKTELPIEADSKEVKPKPVFKPKPMVKAKPVIKLKDNKEETEASATSEDKPKPKFRPRPVIKKKPKEDDAD